MHAKGYVLLVEQDPLLRPLLERWLAEAGYQALPPVGVARPMLVVADAPDPSASEELIDSLRGYAAPILILSARFRRGLAGSTEAARRLGVKKVLPKPFTRKEFLSAVRESLERVA